MYISYICGLSYVQTYEALFLSCVKILTKMQEDCDSWGWSEHLCLAVIDVGFIILCALVSLVAGDV
jgi:hypothetical protein